MLDRYRAKALHALDLNPRLYDPGLVGIDYLLSEPRQNFHMYGARVLTVATLPITVMARTAVRIGDGGPSVVRIPRVGMGGEEFDMFKFRSMKPGSEKQPQPTTDNKTAAVDPRITKVGAVLRRTSVDELAQLRNVREGSMMLVGPRPDHRKEFVKLSEMDLNYEEAYIAAPPGMTDPEQLNGRGDCSWQDRIDLTIGFTRHASFALELRMLRDTVRVVLSQEGAK